MSKGLVQNNPANDPDSKPVKSHSKFKPNYSMYQTVLFGMNTPFFGAEVVPDDHMSLRVASDVDTYTLKAPLMSPVKMHKDYFFASLRSLLPNTAELLITQPRSGEDVNAKEVNNAISLKYISNMFTQTNTPFTGLKNVLRGLMPNGSEFSGSGAGTGISPTNYFGFLLASLLRTYQWVTPLLSTASALRFMGYNVHDMFHGPVYEKDGEQRTLTYDEFFDLIVAEIRKYVKTFTVYYYDGISAGTTGSTTGTPGNPSLSSQKSVLVSMTQSDSVVTTNAYTTRVSFRHLLECLAQNWYVMRVSSVVLTDAGTQLTSPFHITPDGFTWTYDSTTSPVTRNNSFAGFMVGSSGYPWALPSKMTANTDPEMMVNINRLVGYQLANAQFFTSDVVDSVYSCRLWHENQFSLHSLAVTNASSGNPSLADRPYFVFTVNGVAIRYDSCSWHLIRNVFAAITRSSDTTSSIWGYPGGYASSPTPGWSCSYGNYNTSDQLGMLKEYAAWAYFMNIFGLQRSLRYRDYFVGSKPNPLAVGDVNVTVNSSSQFSIVDVTKNIQRQRFLNQVNRVGRKLGEYLGGVFGASPAHDAHDILFLGSTVDTIGAQETDNTGVDQLSLPNSTTSKLRSSSSRYAFEGQFEEPGVVVGIVSFDIIRPYVRNMDRENLHIDRYDYFNPYMQTIGDQAVDGIEMTINQAYQNFAYQLRYSEYKQRVDIAAGGFIGQYLPGYAFHFDPYQFSVYPGQMQQGFKLSPDFIRSHPFEFDQFYVSLTNYSPAGYFHFIIRHDIDLDANRPMMAAPSIL